MENEEIKNIEEENLTNIEETQNTFNEDSIDVLVEEGEVENVSNED